MFSYHLQCHQCHKGGSCLFCWKKMLQTNLHSCCWANICSQWKWQTGCHFVEVNTLFKASSRGIWEVHAESQTTSRFTFRQCDERRKEKRRNRNHFRVLAGDKRFLVISGETNPTCIYCSTHCFFPQKRPKKFSSWVYQTSTLRRHASAQLSDPLNFQIGRCASQRDAHLLASQRSGQNL